MRNQALRQDYESLMKLKDLEKLPLLSDSDDDNDPNGALQQAEKLRLEAALEK
jgi:hypothetical protein